MAYCAIYKQNNLLEPLPGSSGYAYASPHPPQDEKYTRGHLDCPFVTKLSTIPTSHSLQIPALLILRELQQKRFYTQAIHVSTSGKYLWSRKFHLNLQSLSATVFPYSSTYSDHRMDYSIFQQHFTHLKKFLLRFLFSLNCLVLTLNCGFYFSRLLTSLIILFWT